MPRGSTFDAQVSLGFPGLVEGYLAGALDDAKALFRNTIYGLTRLAFEAQRQWVEYASGKLALPNGKTLHRVSGTYADSIKIAVEDPDGGELLRLSVYSDDPKATAIEFGTPAWDMHRVLATSHKVRISKKGHRYLIIPFRWGTPGITAISGFAGEIPQPVYTWWLDQDRQSSSIVSQYEEPSVNAPRDLYEQYQIASHGRGKEGLRMQGSTVMVKRNAYQWGDRLTAKDITDLGLDPSEGAGRNMVGMVRMRNPENTRLGSQYMTFRALSEANPEGWRQQEREGYNVAQAVATFIESIYPAIMEEALRQDIDALTQKLDAG